MLLETLKDEQYNDFIIFTQGAKRQRSSNDKAEIIPANAKRETENAK